MSVENVRNRPFNGRPRLLQLITTLEPGGAEHMLLALTERLRDRFSTHVGFFKGSGELRDRFQAIDVAVHALEIRGRADLGCLARTRKLIRELRPDLIATHLFKADAYGAAAAVGTGIPVVCHKHNEDQYLLRRPIGALGRLVARRADAVITISDAVSRFFVERAGFPAHKVVRIHHGIPLPDPVTADTPVTDPIDLSRVFDIASDARVFGTVARLTEQKGISTLIDAMRVVVDVEPSANLLIVGDGEDRDALESRVAECGLSEQVRFPGKRDDVPRILAALDTFVLPSRWEGFGIVLLEAMAQSCPIVATRVGGIPEVVADGVSGLLVAPDDAPALAAAMLETIRDRAATERRVDAATTALRERFSIERMVEETASVYERALRTR